MDNDRSTTRIQKIAATALITAVLSGCVQTTDWIKDRVTRNTQDSEIPAAPEIEVYIQELGRVASGDPAAQAEIYADALAASEITPRPSTNLRLGLVLAVPGHPESSPEHAQTLLREVLTQEILLTPAEISLAKIHLNNVERQIIADTEARRLRASSSRVADTQEQAVSRRLSIVEAENRQLKRDLLDAEEKLEAISSIERSIRELD